MGPRNTLIVCVLFAIVVMPVAALDNGLRVPPLGWSSWYGFTQNINETMLRDMADGMIASGLSKVGFKHIWIDDGWAVGREGCAYDNTTQKYKCPKGASGKVIVDSKLFPSGMRNLSDYLHARDLKFGIYTSKGGRTCLGFQPTQPNRPGSCDFEQVDADTYVHDWQVDQVKDDGCGGCDHDPFVAMRDALNRTGKPIWYAIHSSTTPGSPNSTVANMWRTGGDLSASSYTMWTNRLDLATTPTQRALAGPGAFPNPDFLEVGYSPRNPKGRPTVQSVLEMRSMFTMWAVLPGPLILSADLRTSQAGLGQDILDILTNTEVININQDPRAAPMAPVWSNDGLQVWKKPLAVDGALALVMWHRNTSTAAAVRSSQTALTSSGQPLTVGSCASASAWDMASSGAVGPIRLRNSSLCIGTVGTTACANPPTLGLVDCSTGDKTQVWSGVDPVSGEIHHPSTPGHDINAASTCKGSTPNPVLLYIKQDHDNEKWAYDNATGHISRSGTQLCLQPWAAPPPPPSPPSPRTITVNWQEMGWPSDKRMAVRDLWGHRDLGTVSGKFTSEPIPFHQANLYTFTAQ